MFRKKLDKDYLNFVIDNGPGRLPDFIPRMPMPKVKPPKPEETSEKQNYLGK